MFEFWILVALDYNDVTWDGNKRGSFGEQKKEEIGKLESFLELAFFFKRKIGRVGGTCDRKPQTLFW